MTREELGQFTIDMVRDFDSHPYDEQAEYLDSNGYYTLTSCEAENGVTLESFVEINRTRLDGKLCFALFHGADVDSCENICDTDWEYTKEFTPQALENALVDIADMYTPEKMLEMYAKIS